MWNSFKLLSPEIWLPTGSTLLILWLIEWKVAQIYLILNQSLRFCPCSWNKKPYLNYLRILQAVKSYWNSAEKRLFITICLHFSFPESRKFLLYARQIEIRGVDIDNPYYNYIISFTVPDIDNVTVVDYDAVEHRIYWSDVRTQTIKRAFINGTGVETVVSAGKNNPVIQFF